jgi:pyruvate dehydrogenase E1 component beta subunit
MSESGQKNVGFAQAIESALAQAMAENPDIFIMGEDVHTLRANLFARFGADRVKSTPISEGAFVGAAVTAAMAGLRPVVEVMLVDFTCVAMDAIINHAAKIYAFSGNKWHVPMVLRCSCGGGYGDGGQHEQSLWGLFAHIPGLIVAVPSTPADAGALMYSAVHADQPVVFLEHKLLTDYWLDYMGYGGRKTVQFDVPVAGATGPIPKKWAVIPFGKLNVVRGGTEKTQISLVSMGVGVHRALEAADHLQTEGISAEVLDLRTIAPLDEAGIVDSVKKTGAVVVIDEDYKACGLSGEIAAIIAEHGIPAKFGRVCTETTIPFDRVREDACLPNVARIVAEVKRLLGR